MCAAETSKPTRSWRRPAGPAHPTFQPSTKPEQAGLYYSFWLALSAPKGTAKEIIGMVNATVTQAFADPAVRQRLIDLGQEIPQGDQQTPEMLRAFQKAEIEKWWPIIKAAGIKGD